MLDRLLVALISCVDRTLEYICALLHDKHGTWQLPPSVIQEVARCLLPDVVAYCESDEGKEAYAKWQAEQDVKKKEQSKVT